MTSTDHPDRTERLLRHSFEEFLDLRRRVLAPKPDDPPASPSSLALAGFLMLKLLIEHGSSWALSIHREQVLAKAPGQRSPTPVPEEVLERLFLASVISTGSVVPPQFHERLANGLRALNQGEVQPLLAPTPSGRWRDPYSLAQLRLQALLHVHVLWGRGLKKEAAIVQVAEAFATSPINMRKWERSWVPEIIGDIRNMLMMARRAGQLAKRYPEGIPEEHSAYQAVLVALEQERSLSKIAEEYRRLMRSSAQTGSETAMLQTEPR
jgi:hypothetical protein